MQYDIQLLGQELDELDHWDFEQGNSKRRKCLACIERDRGTDANSMPEEWKNNPDRNLKRTRPAVLAELRSALLEYNELLLTTKEAAALARPSDRDYLSVVNWFESNKPLVTDEADYIKRKEDIIMLRAESNLSGLEGVVERGLASLDSFLQEHFDSNIVPHLFSTPEIREESSDKHIRYYSPERVDLLINLILGAVILSLFVRPMVVLSGVSFSKQAWSAFERIGVLLVCILFFERMMHWLARVNLTSSSTT